MATPWNNKLFNIELLTKFDPKAMMMRKVTNMNIFLPSSTTFDPNGLFSTEIFGNIGTQSRNTVLSYIDLHIGILHPMLYDAIISMKKYYEDIIAGKGYYRFDKVKGDFELADSTTGSTGYEFFIQSLPYIKFEDTGSDQRLYKIKLIQKYISPEHLIDKWVVIPAGLREYTVSEDGKPSEDEINGMYRKILMASNLLLNIKITKDNISSVNAVRYKIQRTVNAVYDHIISLLNGKHKFIQGKWAKRGVMFGTRNVIAPSFAGNMDLDSEDSLNTNNTGVGIHQFVKSISPIIKNKLHTMFINKILNPNSNVAYLVDKETLQHKEVEIDIKKRDDWLSMSGLDSIIEKLGYDDLIKEPVSIDKYYMTLIYDGGDIIKVINSKNDITSDMKPENIRPLTYGELFYIVAYDFESKYPAFITRYPVTGLGSIFPTWLKLKTTVRDREVEYINGMDRKVLKHYPILTDEYRRSMMIDVTRLAALGADFDGDVMSMVTVCTEESIKEIKDKLNDPNYYLSSDNSMVYSSNNGVIEVVLKHLTT